MMLSTLLLALATTGGALAHGNERSMHPREIASRQLAANRRHVVARNCAAEIASYHRKRKMARRGLLAERDITTGTTSATGTASALQPHETSIKNTTCVTAPEVTEGPYYLNNDLIRQDVREDRTGVLLELDVGVIDTSTCQPLPNAVVEIWSCDAVGTYSGFSKSTIVVTPDGGFNTSITDSDNYLRGGWQTNEKGIVTFNTIFPGYYTGRTIHIHTMVHQNLTANANGTYASRSGSLVHIGQMFFDEDLANKVLALPAYTNTTMTRTYNAEDSILAQENSAGYSAYVDASAISGSDISSGILGFITLGVDTTLSTEVSSPNYYGGEVFAPVTPSSTGGVIIGAATTTTSGTSAANSSSAAQGRFAGLKWLTTLMALLL